MFENVFHYHQLKPEFNLRALLAIVFMVFTISPLVSQICGPYVYMLCTVFLFAFILFYKRGISVYYATFLVPVVLFVVMEAAGAVVFQKATSLPLFIYQQMLWILPILLAFSLLSENKRELLRFIVIIMISCFAITALTSMIGLHGDPSASRWLATVTDSHNARFVSLNLRNVGGYSFVYAITMFAPLVVMLYKQKALSIWLAAPMMIIILGFAVLSQYTTAVLFILIVCAMVLLPQKLDPMKLCITLLIMLLLFVSLQYVLGQVFYAMANSTSSTFLAERLTFVGDSLSGITNTSAASERKDVLVASVNGFIEHPLFGSFPTGVSLAGNHSFIMDTLSNFGVVGGIVLAAFLGWLYRIFYLPFKKEPYYSYMVLSFALYIIFCFINVANTAAMNIPVFFLMPVCGYLLQKKKFVFAKGIASLVEETTPPEENA